MLTCVMVKTSVTTYDLVASPQRLKHNQLDVEDVHTLIKVNKPSEPGLTPSGSDVNIRNKS